MKSKFIYFSAYVLLFLLLQGASAFGNEDQETIQDPVQEWNEILSSSQCKNQQSKDCQKMIFQYSCKYVGTSLNAWRCAVGKDDLVEKDLEKSYQRLLQAIRKLAKEERVYSDAPRLLGDAQQAWNLFRKKECKFVAEGYNGGTLQPAIMVDCLREAAERRIQIMDHDLLPHYEH